MATVGVVVVTYRSTATIESCLRSLRTATTSPMHVVVVDNASDDDSAARAEVADPNAVVIRHATNEGYARGNNAGLKALPAETDWVLFANPDTVWPAGSVDELVRIAAADPRIGVLSPALTDDGGRLQPIVEDDYTLGRVLRGMVRLGAPFRPRVPNGDSTVDWIHTAAALVPISVVHETGGFDERFFLFAEDADFCRRVRAVGKRVVVTTDVLVQHVGGASVDASTNADEAAALRTRAVATYLEKHQGRGARRVFGLVGAVVYGAARHRGQAREAWKAAVG
ncbi:MAG: N-acetylglucosaminyl-diphospho-decaprenol L-rhamnosyltransferase [Actinomycetota bacterium]|jgi:GT2 family glycosyltransferase